MICFPTVAAIPANKMKKLFAPAFLPKLLCGLLILAQTILVGFGVLYLLGVVTDSAKGATFILYFITLIFAADVILSVYIINSSSAASYKIAWMFFVFAFPIGGILLYVFFANKADSRYNRRKLAKECYPILAHPTEQSTHSQMRKELPSAVSVSDFLANIGKMGAHGRTEVEYFALVDFAFEPILRELKKAKHYIFFEFFIIAPGQFWDSILEILQEKVKEGVDVRVIYDSVGSLSTLPSGYDLKLRKMGIKAISYNPFRPILDVRQNNRDHRKILVIDGHTAFTGGFNLADEYINRLDRFGHWKDNAIMLKGEGVYSLTLLFLSTWASVHKEEVDKSKYLPEVHIDEIGGFPEATGFVQPYGDLPFSHEEVGESVYISLLQKAEKYCYITTPYLILDNEMENALCRAAKSGIDVRLVTPHIPDKKAVFNLTRSYYGRLLKSGVRVYEYTPGFVHEKTFLVDGKMATVGTINLDYRSLYLHLECGTFLLNVPAISNMKRDFDDTFALCHEVTLPEWERWRKRNQGYWSMLRVIDPLL